VVPISPATPLLRSTSGSRHRRTHFALQRGSLETCRLSFGILAGDTRFANSLWTAIWRPRRISDATSPISGPNSSSIPSEKAEPCNGEISRQSGFCVSQGRCPQSPHPGQGLQASPQFSDVGMDGSWLHISLSRSIICVNRFPSPIPPL
jgi:hypothetical protein